MLSLKRINAVALRYLVSIKNDYGRLLDAVYWPVLDVTLLGCMSSWTTANQSDASTVLLAVLASISLWQIILNVNHEICIGALEEIWDQNLVNMFSTPLSAVEWVCGIMLVGLLRGAVAITVAGLTASIMFGFNIITPALLVFIPLLIVCGWAIGLISASAIFYWGDKVQQIAWMGVWLYAAVSAIFCPVEVLPYGFQLVGSVMPMTYLFKAIRLYYSTGILDTNLLGITAAMASVYFVLSIFLLNYMFEKSRQKGFARRR